MIRLAKQVTLAAILCIAASDTSLAQSEATGEPGPPDPVDSPKTRLETWFYYQDNADSSGQYKLTEKVYVPLGASGGWRFTGRLDVPLIYTDKEGNGNPNGDWTFHGGDSLTEFYVTTPPAATNLTLGASLRLVWPTGGQPPFGEEQYQWAPSLSLNYRRPDLGYGMTFHPLVRYFMSYHADSADTAKVRKLDLYPTVTFALSDRWFITLYPENPIEYNQLTRQWFVPFEAMVGKAISERLQVGLGGAVKLGGSYPQYQYLLEAQVELRF